MDAASSKIHLVIAGAKQTTISLHACDSISSCSTARILFLTDPGTRPGDFLGAQASCQAVDSDDGSHYWAGIITKAEEIGLNAKNKCRIEITLRPRLWSLSQQTDHRVIQGMSAVDIVNATLARHNFDQTDIQWHLTRAYPVLPYTVQYKETDLNFVQRLLSDNGISYWFDNTTGQDIIHFTDHNSHFPYVDLGAIPLIPPTGTESGSKRAQACFHRFGKTTGSRPRRTTLHDWHDMTPQVRLLAGDIPGKGNNDTDMIYGSGQTQIEAASVRAQTENERNAVATDQYLLDGSVASLAPGMAFSFKHPDLTQYSGDYLVIEMTHKIIQRAGAEIEGDGSDLSYTNSVKLISREKPFRPPATRKPVLPTVYTARVENDGDYALLDEWGRLRLRNVFDLEPSKPTQATPFIRKAQPYGGGPGDSGTATGMHMPLTGGAEVLWGSIDGDPDRPVILGTLPNPETPSPINSDNPAQNRMRTASDNEWLLDDTTDQEKIELKQGDIDEPFNLFRLDANSEGHRIRLACTYGALAVYAKKTLLVDAGDTITQSHGNDRTEIVENQSSLTTKNKDIYAQAATDHVHTAKKNVKHYAKENIEHRAEKITTWRAQKNARLTIKQGDQIISVENSSLVIQSPNKLAITGKGGGTIKIGQNGGGLEIDSGGNVKLYGKKVTLNGASGTTFNGNTSYNIGGAPSLSAGPLPALEPDELPWIEAEGKTPDTHDLELTLTDEFIETLPKHLNLNDGAKYILTTDLGEIRQGTIQDRKIDETEIVIANTFGLVFAEEGGGSQPGKVTKYDPASKSYTDAGGNDEECITTDSPELKKRRLEMYWGTSNWDEIQNKARSMLGLDKASIPEMDVREENWNIFKQHHFPPKVPEEKEGDTNEYGNLLREGPQPGTNAHKYFEKYALTEYGSLMIKKVNDDFSKARKAKYFKPGTHERSATGIANKYYLFRVVIINDIPPSASEKHINLFGDFVPESKKFSYGGQLVDPLAIIHHEFEHTRFGSFDHEAGKIEDEIAAVEKIENPVRALNKLEPRYTYTVLDQAGEPVETVSILDNSNTVKGGTTFCKNDPKKLVE